jgi:hypothetical protein
MRLINTRTFEFEEFVQDVPPYAILSHTWVPDECTYDEWVTSKSDGPPVAVHRCSKVL